MLKLAIFWSVVAVAGAFAGPLETAKDLATKEYPGWTYGKDPLQKQINCVQFLAAVAKREFGGSLTSAEENAILINPPPANLATAVEQEEAITKGIQNALVNVAKKGQAVAAQQAQVGD